VFPDNSIAVVIGTNYKEPLMDSIRTLNKEKGQDVTVVKLFDTEMDRSSKQFTKR